MYWLIVMHQPATGEVKYVISNASQSAGVEELIRVLLSRWHVEMWFERAKQDAGLGAFEVRTYVSLIRHWLCVRLAMCFLSEQTTRLRGEKPADHLRAGRRGRLDSGGEDLATGLAVMDANDTALRLSPAT
jgi:SRSO17 transposase